MGNEQWQRVGNAIAALTFNDHDPFSVWFIEHLPISHECWIFACQTRSITRDRCTTDAVYVTLFLIAGSRIRSFRNNVALNWIGFKPLRFVFRLHRLRDYISPPFWIIANEFAAANFTLALWRLNHFLQNQRFNPLFKWDRKRQVDSTFFQKNHDRSWRKLTRCHCSLHMYYML